MREGTLFQKTCAGILILKRFRGFQDALKIIRAKN